MTVGDPAHVILEAFRAARETLGADAPDLELLKRATARADEMGLSFDFHRVIDTEGVTFLIELSTQRGKLARVRKTDESWEDIFAELGLLE